MWEILERKTPYTALSNKEIVELVCNKREHLQVPTRIVIPSDVYAIMTSCWAYEARSRPTFDQLCERLNMLRTSKEVPSKTGKQKVTPDTSNNAGIYHAVHSTVSNNNNNNNNNNPNATDDYVTAG